ncbi:MAG: type II toxin-antitoxin system RelE/ParE family toxin [Clostridia bacterium]|nr:type II toxin-antitoxin system RelE/ParE family toxin [Clostridia bacterium]
MVINWTESAINDLKDFKNITKRLDSNKYIKELVNNVKMLEDNKSLGKIYFYIKGNIVRQLLYEKHRIFYYEKDNIIHIIAVVHHKQDVKEKLKYIKKYF